MKVPVRVWSVQDGIARGMRMDLGQPVEFQIYEAEETELAATGVGPQSNPIMVRVMRLRPWTPTWEYNPA